MPWTRVQRSMNQVLPISEVNFPWRTREKPAVGKTVQPVRSIPTPFWQRAGTNGSWIRDIKIKCGPSASCLNDEVFSRCYFFVWRGFHSLVMCWLHSWETWKAHRVARSYATNTSSFSGKNMEYTSCNLIIQWFILDLGEKNLKLKLNSIFVSTYLATQEIH